jgi:hypothetical protein
MPINPAGCATKTSLACTLGEVVLSADPLALTARTITKAIAAAISLYSIAVAPDSARKKEGTRRMVCAPTSPFRPNWRLCLLSVLNS